MIKRASTILLTLFLLLTSAQTWAATILPDRTVAGTDFTSGRLDNLECVSPGYETYSTSVSNYTINNGFSCIPGGNKANVFSHSVSGLIPNATYTVIIEFESTSCEVRVFAPNEDNPGTNPGRKEYHIVATNGQIKYDIATLGGCDQGKEFKIRRVTVKGDIEQKITSKLGFDCCIGDDNTLTAPEYPANTEWYFSENPTGPWTIITEEGTSTPLKGESINIPVASKAYYYRAYNPSTNKELVSEFPIKSRICCYLNGKPEYDYTVWAETFELSGNRGSISSEYTGYIYKSSGNIDKGQYCVVKSALSAGADATWFQDLPGHTQTLTDPNVPANLKTNDGYMLIDADYQFSGKAIFQRPFTDLCTNTMYEFSAFIGNAGVSSKGAPVNATFNIYLGAENANDITGRRPNYSVSTGDIYGPSGWKEYGLTFNTGNYDVIFVTLVDNVPMESYPKKADGTYDKIGNDPIIDDIRLSTCSPILQIYSAATMSSGDKDVTECTDPSNEDYTLYAGGDYDINEFFLQPWYLFQKSIDGGNTWSSIGNAQTDNFIQVKIDNTPESKAGIKYRVWVGANSGALSNVGNSTQNPGCGNRISVSDVITLKYECANPCTEPVAPKLTNTLVEVCPGGTYDLNSVFPASNRDSKLTYQWYADNEVDKLPSSSVSIANPGETVYKIRSEEDKVANICPSKFSAVTVKVLTNPVIQLQIMNDEGELVDYKDKTYSICKGDEVTIQTNVDASLDLSWSTDPTDATVNALKAPYITVSPQVKTKYTASVLGGSCYQPSSMYIDVVTVEKPTIKTDDDNVCKGSEINITSNYSDNTVTATAQYEYKWYRTQDKTNWGEPYKTGVNSLEQLTVNEVGTWYYKLVVSVGGCSEESDPLEIKVGKAVEFTVSATDYALCLEDNTYININGLDQTDPDLGTFQWFEGDTPVGAEDEASVNVTPTTTGTKTYTAVVKTVSGCQSKKSLDITVDSKVNLTVSPDQDICVKELSEPITASGADSYEWTPNLGTNGRVSHEEPGDKKYTVKAIAGECDATAVVTIHVHELPEISSITPKSEEETNDMVITMDYSKGKSPFEFSLDGVDFIEVQSGIWENAPIGWNVLYVKDEYECINFKEFYVEPTPIFPDKFFSPNGDNNRDEWKVRNLESYDSYIVEIFDRHGKRLFIQRVGSFNTGGTNSVEGDYFDGWDGEYNGKPMPSDDYWYLITVEDIRKQYTGHFTLKR